jgi:hypothetical protein
MSDLKLAKWLILLLAFPLGLAMCSGDRFRYPCQDPANWDKDFCKMPICDVNRTCPEHIFKGQRDPRLGPPKDDIKASVPTNQAVAPAVTASQGANCGK